MKLQEKIQRVIKQRSGNVVLHSDVVQLGSSTQVSKALKGLQDTGVLMRIGTGVYAKTRKSSVTGALIPAGSLETLAIEALKRLDISINTGNAAEAYNTGKTTQLPGALVINTGRRRISRKITVGGRTLKYENNYNRNQTNT